MVSVFSPAKINLFLAVNGRRGDGFHDLVSVAAPLDFGDDLVAEVRRRKGADEPVFTLECDDVEVPADGSNLILKAAAAYAEATGWPGRGDHGGVVGIHFRLTKRIPMGAGLGGGSSNAVAALRALNGLSGGLASAAQLEGMAARLGSDCVLFLKDAPVVMRGRGERVDLVPAPAAARLRGRRLLLVKPSFGISTPWAYGRMVARGTDYLPAPEAEARLAAWMAGAGDAEELAFNNMEAAAFAKFVALPTLRARLRRAPGVELHMSGSGSACFVLLRGEAHLEPLVGAIRADWGPAVFAQIANIA